MLDFKNIFIKLRNKFKKLRFEKIFSHAQSFVTLLWVNDRKDTQLILLGPFSTILYFAHDFSDPLNTAKNQCPAIGECPLWQRVSVPWISSLPTFIIGIFQTRASARGGISLRSLGPIPPFLWLAAFGLKTTWFTEIYPCASRSLSNYAGHYPQHDR